MKTILALALGALFASTGCKANVGLDDRTLPTDAAQRCVSLCGQLGLPLQSVVIMADEVGCVCGQPGAAPAGTAGGVAAIMQRRSANSPPPAAKTAR